MAKLEINSLDGFLEYTQRHGSHSKSLTNILHGLNINPTKGFIPNNKDYQGYTFFTRPQLNMNNINIANVRKLYSFLTNNDKSPYRYVRNMLDPRLHFLGIQCPYVDNESAFIPCLTNAIKSISGWPDVAMPNFTTSAGARQEEWSITDGMFDIYSAYDIDVTFYNMRNEPILLLFFMWEYYQSCVFENTMMPYLDLMLNNEIDYNTRIYRLVMDETNTFVKKIGATGASFPVTLPTGQFFDYDESKPYSDQTREFTVKFRSMGADYNDHITMYEFNRVQAIFNMEIRKMMSGESHNLEKVPKTLRPLFNYNMYPYINLDTTELEWYINKNNKKYEQYVGAIESYIDPTNSSEEYRGQEFAINTLDNIEQILV